MIPVITVKMERIVHKAKNHKEARDWDIKQVLEMSPDQRQQVAKKAERAVLWQ
jgi:hypothetical protein